LANVGKSGESFENSLASVGESKESSEKGLANIDKSGESPKFPKKAILANVSTRQK
jgi:hypothetical protein